jgi:L-lactate dehydrogenase complex protein LldG
MSDRSAILDRLRQAQNDVPMPAPPRPRSAAATDVLTALIERMTATTIVVDKLSHANEIPAWVANYIGQQQLPAEVVGGMALADLPWQPANINFAQRGAVATDQLAISRAFCAIAESGTALMESGPNNPTSLNFLPDHHIIVVNQKMIVAQWEDAWALCRTHWNNTMPRALNCISGPSSTADVGLTQVFGAHGPRNVRVLVVEHENT